MSCAVATDAVFACERIRDLWTELVPLMAEHHGERGDLAPLDIDFRRYEVLDAQGCLRCYTARVDGELIGYASFVVGTDTHHRSLLRAFHDALFVRPEHRPGGVALRLIRFTEDALAHDGVAEIAQKARGPVGALLERLGYAAQETTYLKTLEPC